VDINIEQIVMWVSVASVAASAITAITPTPKDDAWLAKVYKVIEALGLVVGKAKQK